MDRIGDVLRQEFAQEVKALALQEIRKEGVPPKVLLTPEEAAESLGFSHSAFNQAPWRKKIPVVKVGHKNRYRLKDLETFAENHLQVRNRRN